MTDITPNPRTGPVSPGDVRRCPSCGALVTVEAEWCGQCLTVLDRAEAAPARPARAATEVRPPPEIDPATPGGPSWSCPACGEANALSLDRCPVCGTSFTALFRTEERPIDLDPRSAAISSLLAPGLGHIRLGRVAEGVARLVLFAWAVATAAMVLLSRPATGLGPLGLLAATFVLAATVVYAVSALDALRAAQGAEPVLSTRTLLYGSAGLVLLSVLSLGLLILRVSNPGR